MAKTLHPGSDGQTSKRRALKKRLKKDTGKESGAKFVRVAQSAFPVDNGPASSVIADFLSVDAEKNKVREGESEVLDRAVEVIGNEGNAMRWMGTPIRALGYATPISLLHKPKGRDAVLVVLGRLEHGVL